jgi:hypothetical protein
MFMYFEMWWSEYCVRTVSVSAFPLKLCNAAKLRVMSSETCGVI